MISPVFDMIDELQKPIANFAGADRGRHHQRESRSRKASATTHAGSELQHAVLRLGLPRAGQDLAAPEGEEGINFGIGLFASALDMALGSTTDDDGNPALDTFESDKTAIASDAVARLTRPRPRWGCWSR